MASAFPSPYTVCHIPRSYTESLDPDTGNPILVASAPVIRYAQEISQVRQGSSKDELGAESVDRIGITLQMAVEDCTVYGTDDQVIIDPQITDGAYVAGSGEAYWVDGVPNDQRCGPWPTMFQVFGGVIMLRRVT